MKAQLFPKPINPILAGVLLIAISVFGAIAYYSVTRLGFLSRPVPPSTPAQPVVRKVTALGRLEPETKVVRVAAAITLDGDRVAQLLVQEGDSVQAGQILAILASRDRLEAALQQAQEQVKVAQAKLTQVKAGAKMGEINAQAAVLRRLEAQLEGDRITQLATIRRLEAQWHGEKAAQIAIIKKLEAEVNNAQAEYQRNRQLWQDGVLAESQYDAKRLSLETSRQQLNEARVTLEQIEKTGQQQLNEARAALARIERTGKQQVREANATLNQIAEIRPVDIQAAQAEVDAAIAKVQQAKADLEQVYIRAPMAGQILKIHTRAGEKISENGIVDLGQTNQMVAVAEVYQTDIGKIRLGQLALITGQAFPGELRGTVSQIDRQVSRQNVFSNEPGENLDRRVVEVQIRLLPQESRKVAGLTNLQVQTAILLNL